MMKHLVMALSLGVLVLASMGCRQVCCDTRSPDEPPRQAPAEPMPETFVCPNGQANTVMLDQIEMMARQAGQQQIIQLVQACRWHPATATGSVQRHCSYIEGALTAAESGNWPQCATELEHGPGEQP